MKIKLIIAMQLTLIICGCNNQNNNIKRIWPLDSDTVSYWQVGVDSINWIDSCLMRKSLHHGVSFSQNKLLNKLILKEFSNGKQHGKTLVYKDENLIEVSYFHDDTLCLQSKYQGQNIKLISGSTFVDFKYSTDPIFIGDTLFVNLFHRPLPRTHLQVQFESRDGELIGGYRPLKHRSPYIHWEIQDSVGDFERFFYVSVLSDTTKLDVENYKFRVKYSVVQ